MDYLYAETILTMFNKLLVFILSVRNNRTISLLWKCHRLEQVLFLDHKSNSSFFQLHIIIFGRFESVSKRITKKTLFVDGNYLFFSEMQCLSVISKGNPFNGC